MVRIWAHNVGDREKGMKKDDKWLPDGLAQIRSDLVNTLLIVFAIAAFPTVLVSMARAFETGWWNIMYLHAGLLGLSIVIVALRNRLTYGVRATFIIVSLFVASVAGLITYGLIGLGLPLLIGFCVLSIVLFGNRMGIRSIALAILLLALLTTGVHYHILTFEIDAAYYQQAITSWIGALVGFALLIGLLGFAISYIRKHLLFANQRMLSLMSSLETRNQHLKSEIAARKVSEEALQISEEKFEKAFVSSPDAITISRLADGHIAEVNAIFERMLGYTRQEVIGKTSLDLGLYKDPEVQEVIKNILQKESRIRDFELEVYHKSGEIRTCRLSAELTDLQGETYLIAITRDITERKRAEERFSSVFEALPVAMVIVNETGHISLVNEEAEKTFGFEHDEMVGQSIKMLLPERYRGDHASHCAGFFAARQSKEMSKGRVSFGCHKDGYEFPVEIALRYLEIDGQTMVLSAIVDITKRKRAEEATKKANQRFQIAFEIANIAIFLVGLDGRFTMINDQTCTMFGYTRKELECMNFADITHPEEVDVSLQYFRRLKAGQIDNLRLVKQYLHKDGHTIWAELSASSVRNAQGKPLHFIAYVLDITERVQHEKDMLDSKARLLLVKDIAMEITSDMSMEEVVSNAIRRIFGVFPDYRVVYGVISEDKVYRFLTGVQPSGMADVHGLEVDLSLAPKFYESLLEGQVVINDVESDDRLNPLRDGLLVIDTKSMLNTPISHADGLKALLCLESPVRHDWTDHEISTMRDVAGYLAVAVKNAQLVEEQKKTAADLREASEKLRAESEELTQKNIALYQILEHLEKEKQNYKEQISESVESLLMPIVKKLKKRGGNLSPKEISLLENSLDSIVGREIDVFRKNLVKLSPRELDICELIREGKSSKEISSVLNLSALTIHKHRESIRGKLQLKNKSTNLSAFLRTRQFLTGNTQSIRN